MIQYGKKYKKYACDNSCHTYHVVVRFKERLHQKLSNKCFWGHQVLQLLWSKQLIILSCSKVDGGKGTLGHSHGTNFYFNFFHFICIVLWHMRLLSTPFHNQNKILLPYIMASILLHKLKLNIKRCLLNQSDPILCPNNGNISFFYGVSFVGYLQRDTRRSHLIAISLNTWLVNIHTHGNFCSQIDFYFDPPDLSRIHDNFM